MDGHQPVRRATSYALVLAVDCHWHRRHLSSPAAAPDRDGALRLRAGDFRPNPGFRIMAIREAVRENLTFIGTPIAFPSVTHERKAEMSRLYHTPQGASPAVSGQVRS